MNMSVVPAGYFPNYAGQAIPVSWRYATNVAMKVRASCQLHAWPSWARLNVLHMSGTSSLPMSLEQAAVRVAAVPGRTVVELAQTISLRLLI